MAGAPASTQAAPGGVGGIPLTSNYQLFLCGRTFFGQGFSSPPHAWLTVPLLIYFFGIQFAFAKMSKGTGKAMEIGFQLPGGPGCWRLFQEQR